MESRILFQIFLIIASVALVFVYLNPALERIGATQDEIYQYQQVVDSANQANEMLASLVRTEKSFSPEDLAALDKFLPPQIDEMQVLRDIESILEDGSFEVDVVSVVSGERFEIDKEKISYDDPDMESSDSLSYVEVDVSVKATYKNIKAMLLTLEHNAYPLEIVSLELSPAVDGSQETELLLQPVDLFAADLTTRVYYSPF